jgi:hypothetical protein
MIERNQTKEGMTIQELLNHLAIGYNEGTNNIHFTHTHSV